jgi:hypothetical protein
MDYPEIGLPQKLDRYLTSLIHLVCQWTRADGRGRPQEFRISRTRRPLRGAYRSVLELYD